MSSQGKEFHYHAPEYTGLLLKLHFESFICREYECFLADLHKPDAYRQERFACTAAILYVWLLDLSEEVFRPLPSPMVLP